MSRQYESPSEVPYSVLIARLMELSRCVSDGKADGELTMRIPAEADRDADLVLYEAARRLDALMPGPASAVPEVSEAMLSAAMASGPIPGRCNLGHLLKKAGVVDGQDWVRAALVAAFGVVKS